MYRKALISGHGGDYSDDGKVKLVTAKSHVAPRHMRCGRSQASTMGKLSGGVGVSVLAVYAEVSIRCTPIIADRFSRGDKNRETSHQGKDS